MAVDLYTRRVPASEVLSIALSTTPVLVPGRPEDIAKLDEAKGQYELWHTRISGPPRNPAEERYYRKLVGVVADGLGRHPANLYWDLKAELGKFIGPPIDSAIYGFQAQIKSARDMDRDEYHSMVAAGTEILFLKYLPGVRRKDVHDQVYRLTGERPP